MYQKNPSQYQSASPNTKPTPDPATFGAIPTNPKLTFSSPMPGKGILKNRNPSPIKMTSP